MKTLFKYSAKDSFLIAQTLLTMLLAVIVAVSDLSMLWVVLMAPLHILLIASMHNTSLHHHTHWATFQNKKLNQIYELFIAAAAGMTPQTYRYLHGVHHKYVNDSPVNGVSKDRISVFEHGVNGEPENVWTFCFRNAITAWIQPWKYVLYQMWQAERPKTPMMNYIQWRNEQFAMAAFFLSIIAINFVYGVWLLFVVYFIAHFLDYAWHYGEHHGVHHHRGDTTRDSIGIYGKLYNFLCFRSGFHQEHHNRMSLHWTRLHELTPQLPADRTRLGGMHITNIPWLQHLRELVKL